ncbi:hypothetical protein [Minwuia sp.]|uniref:hypothetical protein n=1 Tax=Minwuia sp. TaxID=2493630 RepID=UPI003A90DAAC
MRNAVLAAALVLAACTTDAPVAEDAGPVSASRPGAGPPPGGDREIVATGPRIPPPPAPRPDGRVVSKRPRTGSARTDPKPAQPKREPVRPLSSLIGLTETEIRAELGAPRSTGDQPPATVWRYDLTGCELSLFLFRDVASGEAKALTFEVAPRETTGGAKADRRCAEQAASS